jgi:hypothetical protein
MHRNTCGITPGTVRAGCLTDDSSADGTVKAAPPAVFINRILLQAFALLMLLPVLANPALAAVFVPPPNTVNTEINGCRYDGNPTLTETLGDFLPNEDGNFTCQDPAPLGGNDTPYTTGNLGKGWNELDLVPHRLILDHSGDTEVIYNIVIAADYTDGPTDVVGYDYLTPPEVIQAPDTKNVFSTPGCAVTSELIADYYPGFEVLSDEGGNPLNFEIGIGPGLTGGSNASIFRVLTVTQPATSTCVLDWAQRLSVESSEYNGSNLQAYKFEADDFQTGKATVPLPVNEIEDQGLDKVMTAVQDVDYSWSISKTASPTPIEFGNTCDAESPTSAPVEIDIEWRVFPGELGQVTITTVVTATNTASRDFLVDVTDVIRSGTTELGSNSATDIELPAGSSATVLNTSITAAADSVDLNDIATVTYKDCACQGIPTATTTATASADIQIAGANNEYVTVTDSEWLVMTLADGFQFSADEIIPAAATDSITYASGTPYTLGTLLDDANTSESDPLLWTSVQQQADTTCTDDINGCVVGSLDISKTVYRDSGPMVASGVLKDIAVLNGDTITTNSGLASINISAYAEVDISTIKTIPDILQTGESADFTFNVCLAGEVDGPCVDGDGTTCVNCDVATYTFSFGPGDTSMSHTFLSLDPGLYRVYESAVDSGWGTVDDQYVDLRLPALQTPADCLANLQFDNDIAAGPAEAAAAKITLPPSATSWDMTLTGPGGPETITVTAGTGLAFFSTELQEGTYTITETQQGAYSLVSVSGDGAFTDNCTFTVDYPADTGRLYTCEFTNALAQIDITKTCDELSKVGDDVDYEIILTNTTAAGAEDLVCTVTDSLLDTIGTNVTLASGESATFNPSRTVEGGDPDPLLNIVNASCGFGGDTGVATATANCSTDLFQPSITLEKTGDALSKIGDPTDYSITLNNTSSSDTPDMTCTVTDAAVGVSEEVVLAAGEGTTINATAAIPADATDPYVNTASVSCSVAGFPNVLTTTASHSVNLFQPAIAANKTGDAYSKVGDDVDYTITLTNSSSGDTPAMICTAVDSLLGTVFNGTLLPGDTVLNLNRTVQAGDADPLVNTVTLSCSPYGFPNSLTTSASHSTDLVSPSFTVAKVCTNEPVSQDGPATWDVTITNTGDVELIVDLSDGIGSTNLPAGESQIFPVSQDGPFGPFNTPAEAVVSNTVTATWTLPAEFGLANTDTVSASDDCVVAGKGQVIKLMQGLPNEDPNPTMPWTFTLQDCGTDGCSKDDPQIAQVTSPPSAVDLGVDLVPYQYSADQRYRLCEVLVPTGWTIDFTGDANDDGTPDTAIGYAGAVADAPVSIPPGWSNTFDPQFAPPPAIWSNDERCLNFVADAGATEVFQINNSFPGGRPSTIGFWKNWNSCTGGGQVDNAVENGGDTSLERLTSGNALLDDVLQAPGLTVGTLNMVANDNVYDCDDGTQDAVNILDKRDISGRNKKMASDAAYGLAAQLLAALANEAAGAGVCADAGQAIIDGQQLLADIGFDGSGDYYGGKGKNKTDEIAGYTAQDANVLAGTLDTYNNGNLCP